LLAAALVAVSQPAWAAWYQVEIVVFEALNPELDGERFYGNPGLPDRANTIELIEEAVDDPLRAASAAPVPAAPGTVVPPIAFLELPASAYRLDGVARVLKLSRGYRPLLHVAWQQPGHGPDRLRAVHLEKFKEDPARAPEGAAASGEFEYLAPEILLDGTVRLRISRFLHADLDFAYFPDAFAQLQDTQLGGRADDQNYLLQRADYVRLRTSRKLKLNELHYFDHPLFGIILQVSRLRIDTGEGGEPDAEPLEE